VAAALAKVAWRKELAAAGWLRLALWTSAACALASLAGLVAFGRDGMVASYAAMVCAAALALLWFGFGPGRR